MKQKPSICVRDCGFFRNWIESFDRKRNRHKFFVSLIQFGPMSFNTKVFAHTARLQKFRADLKERDDMAIQLRQDEQIQCEAQFHWSNFLVPGIWAAIFGLGLLGTLFTKDGHSAIGFTVAVGFGPLAYIWLRNKNKTYVVTNQRLYVEDGILSKTKIDIPFHKINDISFSQDLMQRMFGSGNIAVMTGNDKARKLNDLDCPEKFRESLSKLCQTKAS